jgi:hypothetical protein
MKSSFFILVVLLMVGCTEPKHESKEKVTYNIKTFFLGEDRRSPEDEVKYSSISKKDIDSGVQITMHDSNIYDPIVENKVIKNVDPLSNYKNKKPSKTIKLGKEEIKIFDRTSPSFTNEEIESLRKQKL